MNNIPVQRPVASRRSLWALDSMNVFLADVRDGIGPYLAIYLAASHNWDAASIGIAMSAMGIATLIAQTPAGVLIDRTTHKRAIIAMATLAIALACIAMTHFASMFAIITSQVICGIAAAIIAPGVGALTLGLVGYRNFARRMGRNEGFNHFGNVFAAAVAGAVGHFIAREWIFYLVAAMAIGSLISILSVREADINHAEARGCSADISKAEIESSGAIWQNSSVLIFTFSMMLFHFANAAMLPLAGQLLSSGKQTGGSLYMSACIIVAQLVMIPVALASGKLADTWGRKPLLLIALGVLPIRGLLYTLSANPFYIVSVQVLDGIAAGIFGVVSLLVIADLSEGKGNFNAMSGAVMTAVGLGASLSNAFAGYVVFRWGFSAGFLTLAGIAVLAFGLFAVGMRETRLQSVSR